METGCSELHLVLRQSIWKRSSVTMSLRCLSASGGLLAKGKITQDLVSMLLSWRHSGFNVFCGPRMQPGDQQAMESLARGTCPPPAGYPCIFLPREDDIHQGGVQGQLPIQRWGNNWKSEKLMITLSRLNRTRLIATINYGTKSVTIMWQTGTAVVANMY